MKHEPDGVTRRGLEREIPKLLDRFVASGALVAPRRHRPLCCHCDTGCV
ncbi:hypothetical protein XSR1_1000002 [Xenorhabdus szentirmaii DSM 16338]|uniref:Uncharacterized protein n=1 Tax=Xenorhabdus szentirmaii DSM 16338 TaxID=1427518 RepID=W1ITZ6_9GAMM|nr:hypothetical protein XSR1_1000002 [Xenorhabdus szentirmaii DSM 16338]